MTLDEYQQLAARTIGTRTQADQLSNMALGLAGEAGETADMLKKHLFHGKPLNHDDVVKELSARRKRTHWVWCIFPSCACWVATLCQSCRLSRQKTSLASVSAQASVKPCWLVI